MIRENREGLIAALFEIVIQIIFFVQCAVLLWFNLFKLKYHLGFDTSGTYLAAALLAKEGANFNNIWTGATCGVYDQSLPLISLIYRIVGSPILAAGITNIIIDGVIIVVAYITCQKMGFDKVITYIVLNLILCPYLLNGYSELGYFACMLVGPAYYSVRMLTWLIALLVVTEIRYNANIRKSVMGGQVCVLIVLTFFCGYSTGIYIVLVMILPILIFIVSEAIRYDDIRVFIRRDAIVAYIALVAAAAGKAVAVFYGAVTTSESVQTWTSIQSIDTNFTSVFKGILVLANALPVSDCGVQILSINGIKYVFPLVIVAIMVIAIVNNCRYIGNKEFENGIPVLLLFEIICPLLVFTLYNATYGEEVFEERYLLTIYLSCIFLIGFFLKNIKIKRIYSVLMVIALVLSVMAVDVISDYKYLKSCSDNSDYDWVIDTIDSKDEVVYVWGQDIIDFAASLRVVDMDNIYKIVLDVDDGMYYHWENYNYYDDYNEYQGRTWLLLTVDTYQYIPDYVKESYTYVDGYGDLQLYCSDGNDIHIDKVFTKN